MVCYDIANEDHPKMKSKEDLEAEQQAKRARQNNM